MCFAFILTCSALTPPGTHQAFQHSSLLSDGSPEPRAPLKTLVDTYVLNLWLISGEMGLDVVCSDFATQISFLAVISPTE